MNDSATMRVLRNTHSMLRGSIAAQVYNSSRRIQRTLASSSIYTANNRIVANQIKLLLNKNILSL